VKAQKPTLPAAQPAPAAATPESMDLLPREAVRIYVDLNGQIAFKHRGLADARGFVACVLAAIDRQLVAEEVVRQFRAQPSGDGNGQK
jgi:hypothetical protein